MVAEAQVLVLELSRRPHRKELAGMPENWFARIGDFLGGWPDDYLVLDLETQGLDQFSTTTLPLEFGWCLVENRSVVSDGAVVLDWTRYPRVDLDWLATTMEKTRNAMVARGLTYPFDISHLQTHGVDPREAITAARRLVKESLAARYRIVGHNLYAFDRPLLERSFASYIRKPLLVPPDAVLDTGMIEKARMLKTYPPSPGELAVRSWYDKIRRANNRVRWNMSEHCARTYGLPVDITEAHAAGYDCRINHLLVERMRKLSTEVYCGAQSQAPG